jgi:hypothetical protein
MDIIFGLALAFGSAVAVFSAPFCWTLLTQLLRRAKDEPGGHEVARASRE